jgi:hypothetical protein
MAEHVVYDNHTTNGTKYYFVNFHTERETAEWKSTVFEFLLIVEGEVNVLWWFYLLGGETSIVRFL